MALYFHNTISTIRWFTDIFQYLIVLTMIYVSLNIQLRRNSLRTICLRSMNKNNNLAMMIIIYFLSFFVICVQTKIVLHKTVNNGNYMGRWVKNGGMCLYAILYWPWCGQFSAISQAVKLTTSRRWINLYCLMKGPNNLSASFLQLRCMHVCDFLCIACSNPWFNNMITLYET